MEKPSRRFSLKRAPRRRTAIAGVPETGEIKDAFLSSASP